MNLVPSKTQYLSKTLDEDSIALVRDIFRRTSVDCAQLQTGGSLPDIDGYLDLCDDEGRAKGKITVQVKHLTYKASQSVTYDIPISVFGYAKVHKGEVVVFIACDTANQKIYWKYIGENEISEVERGCRDGQKTWRVHFGQEDCCHFTNKEKTIEKWKNLYKQKMNSIKDEYSRSEVFAKAQKSAFNLISSEFHGLSGSHIIRQEVSEILDWLDKEDTEKSHKICLLTGKAGVGKSVVLKDLIAQFDTTGVKYICIKADSLHEISNPVSVQEIQNAISCFSATYSRVVLIIDQIDALSQSLSNDRNRLNSLMTVLLSLKEWSRLRAVVSCREYDLEYDQTLNSLKQNAEIIRLGLLAKKDVDTVLCRLNEGLKDKIDKQTFALLRNAQYLNTYCFICQRRKEALNFHSPILLYDALWDMCLKNVPASVAPENIEHVLFEIARKINISETLKPVWIPEPPYLSAAEHLASCGLILKEDNSLSFFHQTFYDYTLARYCVSTNKSFIADFKEKFQGLELRTTVKAILEFERGHNQEFYIKDINELLSSTAIRLHLKLLAISVLASVDKPFKEEKKLVREYFGNHKLMIHFLRGVENDTWFKTVYMFARNYITDLTRNSELYHPLVYCLSKFSFDHPCDVFRLAGMVKDEDARCGALLCILRGHNDYRSESTISAFQAVKEKNPYYIGTFIKDMILTNHELALKETGSLITDFLEREHKADSHLGYMLIDVLCNNLFNAHPADFLNMTHRCIVGVIKKKSVRGAYGYSITNVFGGWRTDKYVRKWMDLYEQALIKQAHCLDVVRPFVDELLALDNEISLSMAFVAMAECPDVYHDTILDILEKDETVEKYIQDSVAFFFLKMLRAWGDGLNDQLFVWYQKRILAYKSSTDFLFIKNRHNRPLCYNLWRDKWKLICNTLPESGLIKEMVACSQELMRRFGHKLIVKREDYPVTAHICTGVVSDEQYLRWPLKNWLTSFLKLDENRCRRNGRHPISITSHADAYKRCVVANPDRFKCFVKGIASRDDIKSCYKIAGIEGLLEGSVDIDELWQLVKGYINSEYAATDFHSFGSLIKYYVKSDNKYIDFIIPVLKEVLESHFDKHICVNRPIDSRPDIESLAENLIATAINSKQGQALKFLLYIFDIPVRKKSAYTIISDVFPRLNRYLRALLLHYFSFEDCCSLLKMLLNDMGPEALWMRGDLIQWYFYHRRDVVADFVDRMETDSRSHEVLALIYFYGLGCRWIKEDCEARLEKILAANDEKVVSRMVRIAIEMYSDSDYTDASKQILKRFASDTRKSIVDVYCYYCDVLPVTAFDFYCSISPKWSLHKSMEICEQLKYVSKCVSCNPVGCYQFLKSQDYTNVEDEFINDDITRVFLP